MPLSTLGSHILTKMQDFYGKRIGKKVFYASENAHKPKGVTKKVKK